MNLRLLSLLLSFGAVLSGSYAAETGPGESLEHETIAPASTLRVSNNHPFSTRETLRFHIPAEIAEGAGNLLAVSHSVAGGTVEAHYLPIQLEPAKEGNAVPAWIDVQLRADESRAYTFQDVGGGGSENTGAEIVQTFSSGLPRKVEWSSELSLDLFDLHLLEILEGLDQDNRLDLIQKAIEEPLSLEFELQEESHGPVTSTLLYRATGGADNEYEVNALYHLFSSGSADVEVSLRTTNRSTETGYLAVAKEIPTATEAEAAVGSRGETIRLNGDAPSSSSGDAADWTRDLHWLAWGDLNEGESSAVLAEFSPTTAGTLVNERVLEREGGLAMISEITRGEELTIPAPDEEIQLRYRVLNSRDRSLEEVNQAFTSFAGYQGRHLEDEEFHVSFGVGGVSFGTGGSHTFAEGDWRQLKDVIQRDMRIANAMGLDWHRIQGFDSPDSDKDHLATEDGESMVEYLAFMAQSARDTGMKLFLDLSLSPADAALVAERFGDAIGFYQISLAPIDQWQEVRDAIQAVQPNASVAIPGGAAAHARYDLPGDAIAEQHDPDSTTGADVAIGLGGYATRHGMIPLNSGYAVSADPRLTEQRQANRFFENANALLGSRSVSTFLPFPFSETLTDASGTDGAMLRLDGTPKRQAHAFHEIIRRHSEDDHRLKQVEINIHLLSIRPGERKTVPVQISNATSQPLEIQNRLILPEGLTAEEDEQAITLGPRQTRTLQREIQAHEELQPGVYHFFEEVRYGDTVRLGWSYASNRRAPRLDLDTEVPDDVQYAGGLESLDDINLSNLRHLVFGADAPDSEIGSAFRLQQTLRSATGADVRRWPHNEVGEAQTSRSHVLLGNQETNPLVADIAKQLPVDPLELDEGEGVVMAIDHPTEEKRFVIVVSGRDSAGVEKAAADFLSRYWRYAKDAAKVGGNLLPGAE